MVNDVVLIAQNDKNHFDQIWTALRLVKSGTEDNSDSFVPIQVVKMYFSASKCAHKVLVQLNKNCA